MSDMDGKAAQGRGGESGDERVQSQFVIRTGANRNIQRCFSRDCGINMIEDLRCREELPIVAVPIALKAFGKIVLSFQV